jgi:O-antigen/teichoic acid export membrane protein
MPPADPPSRGSAISQQLMQTTLNEPPATVRRWRASPQFHWATRGAWAVLDQGLFAGSNFLLTILLARWLAPAEFGAFTIAYSVFLLAGTVHTALVTEPLLVFGSGKYATLFRAYLGAVLRGHWLLSAATAVVIAVAAAASLLLGSASLASALAAMALASPIMLFSWFARRACVARLEPRLSAASGAVYFVLMLIGLEVLRRSNYLSPATAFGVLGVCSLVAGGWTLSRLRSSSLGQNLPNAFREAGRDHWRYGRWSLATGTLAWVPGNILLLLVPTVGGLAASGVVKALTNLVLPIMHANIALGMLMLPGLIRARAEGHFVQAFRISGALLVGGSLVYWLLIVLFARPLLDLLYQGQYTEYEKIVWWAGALPVTAAIVAVLGAALRAMERPDRIFWAYTVSTMVSLTIGVWAVRNWAVTGVLAGQLISSVATGAALAFYLLRQRVGTPVVEATS